MDMPEYVVEFNLRNDSDWYTVSWYGTEDIELVTEQIKQDLIEAGGGHANIFFNNEFITNVEV
jgi:hypothetical protein